MRILVASDQWYPDVAGGSARVATETSRRLAARGHELTVLVPRNGSAPAEERDGSLTVLRTLARSALPQTVTDVFQTRRNAGGLGNGFDLLLAHQPTTAAGLLRARLGAPLVSVFHASPAREARYLAARRPSLREGVAARVLAPLLDRLEATAQGRSERVLVLSEFSRSLLLEDRPDASTRIRLVGGGVDVDAFSPGDGPAAARARLGVEDGPPLLFTARRLEPRMGLDELIAALRHLDARLVIAGTGSLEHSLRRRAEELGVADRVRLVGFVADAELVDWYRAADVVVVPTAAYEGFGLVVAEALASGTPVVGTPVGAIPELLRPLDERLVAAGSDAEALAVALRGTLDAAGPELRARCRAYACEHFDWERVIAAWEEALLDAVPRRADRAEPVRPERIDVLGAPLDPVTLPQAVSIVADGIAAGRPLRHASVNAPKIVRMRVDTELAEAMRRCELVTADGQPVVWAARLLGRPVPERVAGIDLMEELLARAEADGLGVYLLGAEAGVLQNAVEALRERHPALVVAGTRDGFFAERDEPAIVDDIRGSGAQLLFIALPTPRKELFLDRHGAALPLFAMGVGGAFDVLGGARRRAPLWMQRAGLEWLFRMVQEPRRLAGRYGEAGLRFALLLAGELVRTRLLRRAER